MYTARGKIQDRTGKPLNDNISRRRCCRTIWPNTEQPDEVYAGKIDNATDPLRAMAATVWGEARASRTKVRSPSPG